MLHRERSGIFEDDEKTEVSGSAPLVDFGNNMDHAELAIIEVTSPTRKTDMSTMPETRTAAQRTLARVADAMYQTIPPREARDSKSMSSVPAAGVKYDNGKPRFSLVPLKALRAVVRVLEAGAKKYAPENWRKVPDARQRYYDAAHRHIGDWWEGETKNLETGEHNLAHAICCLIFLLALELELE